MTTSLLYIIRTCILGFYYHTPIGVTFNPRPLSLETVIALANNSPIPKYYSYSINDIFPNLIINQQGGLDSL